MIKRIFLRFLKRNKEEKMEGSQGVKGAPGEETGMLMLSVLYCGLASVGCGCNAYLWLTKIWLSYVK
jgi:hypothetical protein